VYGPSESDDELLPNAPLITKLRIWAWQRSRGTYRFVIGVVLLRSI